MMVAAPSDEIDIVLQVDDLIAGYGDGPILNGLSLKIAHGECVAVLGRNGVGKTTLLRAIAGQLRSPRGTIAFDRNALLGRPSHDVARRGIAYVPQGRGIFAKLTVDDNLKIGTRAAGGKGEIPPAIFDYFPIIGERRHQLGGTLSGGEQQMLAIARALCGRPKLLMLDEPSEGIQPSIVKQLGRLLPEIRERSNVTMIVVEQNLDLALSVGQRFLIMDKGRIVHQGSTAAIGDAAQLHQYLTI
jgi:branched-chain amino acid transport system ATP-binding protein